MILYYRNLLLSLSVVFLQLRLSIGEEDLDLTNYLEERRFIGGDDDEFILCRYCGSDITSSDYIITKTSPLSLYSFNDTLFDKERVLIQLLSGDIFLHLPVFTASQSTCIVIGEWEEHDSWFPGYHWKACVCPDCGSYVGLVFEPITLTPDSDKFFGLILMNLIGESFADSLSIYSLPGNLVK